jgi:hypothetical protein
MQQFRQIDGRMQNRLYIENLASDVAVTTLQELFGPHGFVMDVRLVSGSKAFQSHGFAFVTMATDESANAAMRALNGVQLHGLVVKVNVAGETGAAPVGSQAEGMRRMPKRNPKQEYRLKQRERVEASPFMADRFPHLKALKVMLEYYDATGLTKNGEMKCTINLKHARSVLWYACSAVECLGGDFDLTDVLEEVVAGRRKVATGELQCQGTQKRGNGERMPCQARLHYKLTLNYDRSGPVKAG